MEPEKVIRVRLLFVRHGATDANKSKIICGQRPGNLTEVGFAQAKKTGVYLKNHKFDQIFVSDLRRTKQTFQSILEKAPSLENTPTVFTPLIRQRSGGVLEGKPLITWSQNAKKQGKSIREYKCEKAENWKDVNQRGRHFLKLIFESLIKNPAQKEIKILAVTHGGFIMEFHNIYRTFQGQEEIFANNAGNCSLHEFQITHPWIQTYDPNKLTIKCSINNFAAHL